jgi:hypothetical protein
MDGELRVKLAEYNERIEIHYTDSKHKPTHEFLAKTAGECRTVELTDEECLKRYGIPKSNKPKTVSLRKSVVLIGENSETEPVPECDVSRPVKSRTRKPNINRDAVRELFERGMTKQKIAESLNCSQGSVARIVKEDNLLRDRIPQGAPTKVDKEKCAEMLEEGKEMKEIAAHFGVSQARISMIRKELLNNL